jgi:hypothetical protein
MGAGGEIAVAALLFDGDPAERAGRHTHDDDHDQQFGERYGTSAVHADRRGAAPGGVTPRPAVVEAPAARLQ